MRYKPEERGEKKEKRSLAIKKYLETQIMWTLQS